MIRVYVLSLLMTVVFLNISCKKDNPLESNMQNGKRDFLWNIDSVDYGDLRGSIQLQSIWGSAPDDIWGASYSSDVRDCLWHYDGKVWKRATENTPLTTSGLGSREVGHVWGTAKNDVWAIGGRIYGSGQKSDPFVMHYNGKWTEIPMTPDMSVGSRDILGINKDNFWIAGVGTITHYDHGIWKKYIVGDSITIVSKLGFIAGTIYATSYQSGKNVLYLQKLINDKFLIIDSTDIYNGTFGHSGIVQSGNKVYSFGSHRIASTDLINNEIKEKTWRNDIDMTSGFRNSFILSPNNIWASGYPSCLYNYNGVNWQQINISIPSKVIPYNCGFDGIWTNGNEIIICDSDHGVIYHGK